VEIDRGGSHGCARVAKISISAAGPAAAASAELICRCGASRVVALDPLPVGANERAIHSHEERQCVTRRGQCIQRELLRKCRVQTRCKQGKVAGSARRTELTSVAGHKIGLAVGPAVAEPPVLSHDATETPDWIAWEGSRSAT